MFKYIDILYMINASIHIHNIHNIINTYSTFVRKSAAYNFLCKLIPSLTSPPVKAYLTVPSHLKPAKESSCNIPHLLNKL